MNPLIFHVEAAGQFRPVEMTFATESEVRRVRDHLQKETLLAKKSKSRHCY